MNFIEVLSEDDVILLKRQSIILAESNSQQLYEAKLIKKIKDTLLQKFKGSITNLKKILLQAKIKVADFVKYIAKNIKKIKNIRILKVEEIKKTYTDTFNGILKVIKTKNESNKLSLINALFEDRTHYEQSIETASNYLKGIYIPETLENDISSLEVKELKDFESAVKKASKEDKKFGFARNFMSKIATNKKFEKAVKSILVISLVGGFIANSMQNVYNPNSDLGPPSSGIVLVVNDAGDIQKVTDDVNLNPIDDGRLSSGKQIDIESVDSKGILELNDKLGDIVKSVKSGIFFIFSDDTSKSIKKLTDSTYHTFANSNKKTISVEHKLKIKNKEVTYTVFISSSKDPSEIDKEVNSFFEKIDEIDEDILTKAYKKFIKFKITKVKNDFITKDYNGVRVDIPKTLENKLIEAGILPPLFSINSKHVIRHETGHLLQDGETITALQDKIIEILSTSKGKTFSSSDIQKIILQQISIKNYNNKNVDIKDLEQSDIEEISNLIKITVGQLMFFKIVELKNNKFKYKGKASKASTEDLSYKGFANYISRNNEARQHIMQHYSFYETLKNNNMGKDAVRMAKNYVNVLLNIKNNYDIDTAKAFQKMIRNSKQNDLAEVFLEEKNFSVDKESLFFIARIKEVIKNKDKTVFNYLTKFIAETESLSHISKSKSSKEFVFNFLDSLEETEQLKGILSLNNNIDHDHEGHDHQHESIARLTKKVLFRLLKESKYAGSQPEESYQYGWPEFDEKEFDKDGMTTWHEDRAWTEQYLKDMGMLK